MSSFGDFISLSRVCDLSCAKAINREVSDGVIAPGFESDALELLSKKRGGNYTVISIDPEYKPDSIERRQIYGITFVQGRNEQKLDATMLSNIVTEKKTLPESAVRDLIIASITLKYTQSNSVCYAKDGQTIGVGAGQQSRIHCTRLAGQKSDLWHLRQHPKVLALPFVDKLGRPDRDNCIDLFLSENDSSDVLDEGRWQRFFTERPSPFTPSEKREWLDQYSDVALASDAFFPFGDNVERAFKSGVKYIAQPGGSIRDDDVIDACNRHDITMAFTGIRLFHH